MQQHYSSFSNLNPASISVQQQALVTWMRPAGYSQPILFQAHALRLPSGYLQTQCDQCGDAIQFSLVRNEIERWIPVEGAFSAKPHPAYLGAKIEPTEAFCASCEEAWADDARIYYEEVEPKLRSMRIIE